MLTSKFFGYLLNNCSTLNIPIRNLPELLFLCFVCFRSIVYSGLNMELSKFNTSCDSQIVDKKHRYHFHIYIMDIVLSNVLWRYPYFYAIQLSCIYYTPLIIFRQIP